MKADPVIKDVCDVCNSGTLSSLDACGIGITEKYFLPSGHGVTPPVRFEYESFETFSRWILKLLYNDARSSGLQVGDHAAFRHYILGQAGAPHNFSIFGGLLRPAAVPKKLIAEVGTDLIYPRDNTMAILTPREVASEYRDKLMFGRMIRFRAFIFWLLVWHDDVDRDTRRQLQQIIASQYQCKHIHPGRPHVDLHYTRINTLRFLISSNRNDFETVRPLVTE